MTCLAIDWTKYEVEDDVSEAATAPVAAPMRPLRQYAFPRRGVVPNPENMVAPDLPEGRGLTDADAAAIGLRLLQRRSGRPISEDDIGPDT